MKISLFIKRHRGMTLVEVIVVMAVVMVLIAMLLPALSRPHATNCYISCVNNLKQVGLCCRIWEGDHGDKYPWAVSQTNGGTMEFTSGPNAFRHFQVMSNELSTPKTVMCPAETDKDRLVATNFQNFNNSNISFFVGIQAVETNPMMILAGDHNITNGISIRNGLLDLTTNSLARWTSEVHKNVSNVALADGSVQMLTIAGLRATIANTGLSTNWLQMPVLAP
jgi:prepilin-type processing-associated H-X9-DG protein